MKKLTLGSLAIAAVAMIGSAQAADMPVKAAPVVTPVWSWTGFYWGGNVGYSWGRSNTDYTLGSVTPAGVAGVTLDSASATNKLNGAIGGVQLGYNWQSANWVYGLEADIQWSGQKGSLAFSCVTAVPCSFPPAINTTIDQKLKWFGTVRGRLGTTVFSPTVMAYVTGGLAYGEITTDLTLSGATTLGVATSAVGSFSTTKAGWVVGAGLEGRIVGNWTGKIEYLYMDLGSVSGGPVASLIAPSVRTNFANASFSSRVTDNIVRVGLNYKFAP